MRERILIVFIALALGLIITTLVYFLYQQTKTIPQKAPNASNLSQQKISPTVAPGYLTISSPPENSITNKRLVQIKGTTHPEDTLIVSTNQEDTVAKPASDGKFSVSATIDAGANIIIVRTIAPSGEEYKATRVITFSTEEF